MVSGKQLTANRKNARKSSGPKTKAGKDRSSLNALSHGLRAQQVILPGEDEDEFNAFREALHLELLPHGQLQEELFEMIVDGLWRLRRCRRAEGGALWAKIMMRRQLRTLCDLDNGRSDLPNELNPEVLEIGLAYVSAAECLAKLDRYESSIARRIDRATRELKRLQAEDMGPTVERDDVIDVLLEPDADETVPTPAGDDGKIG